jgi:hypothetical protein
VKRHMASGGGNGQAEVSVFWVTVKGDQSVVQQALVTAQNIARANGVHAAVMTPKPPVVALPPPLTHESASDLEGAPHADKEPMAEGEHQSSLASSPSRKQRAFTTPDPIDELKANQAPDPFKDFAAGRALTSFNERGLAAATWIRDKRGTKQFGIRHLYTCFKMLGWKLPDDPASLLRTMKKANYVRRAAPGLYELTSVGDNTFAALP